MFGKVSVGSNLAFGANASIYAGSSNPQDKTLAAAPECPQCGPIRFPIEVSVAEMSGDDNLGIRFG